jgi:hemerythrin-like metal-binding protein
MQPNQKSASSAGRQTGVAFPKFETWRMTRNRKGIAGSGLPADKQVSGTQEGPMIHIPWKDRYNISYKEIDDQHKGLVGILNELADIHDQEASGDQVAGLIHRLCPYALTHYATEECYMAAVGYSELGRYQGEHAAFINDLLGLNLSYDPGDFRLVEATFTFVQDWYLHHIIRSDLDDVASLKGYHARATIQAIIFDLGEVVCAVHEDLFLEAAAALYSRSADALKALIDGQSSLFRGYESSFLYIPEFVAQFSALCGQDIPQNAFIQAYAQVFSPLESTLTLLRRLKPRYRLGLIADTTPLRLEQGLARLDILPLFDAVTRPYEVEALKPDLAVFNDITTKLDLMAEECIYADDRPPSPWLPPAICSMGSWPPARSHCRRTCAA